MKCLTICVLKVAILSFLLTSPVLAQEESKTYSGDIWSRSTLTGDWCGMRNELAQKGVTFSLALTQVAQGIVRGGKDTGWQYGGRNNFTIHVDTGKLGWWPGGFFTAELEGSYGNHVNYRTGGGMPVNTNQIFPMPLSNDWNVPAVVFTQFLSHYLGVFMGKLDTTSGSANEFADGKGDTQFLNLAFNFNPVVLMTVPYSALGGGLILLPTKDPDSAHISLSVLDSEGEAYTDGFDTLDDNGTAFTGEGRVRTNFFGLTGHQLLGGSYSNRRFAALDQRLGFIVIDRGIQQESGSWTVFYNFDQYLYEPKKGSGQGFGIFGRFGISDGDPNPVHHFYSVGFGGKGLMRSRPLDSFGIGYYYLNVSSPNFKTLRVTRSFLKDGQGFEVFYNIAITPWMILTPDFQVTKPAQRRFASSIQRGPVLPVVTWKDVHNAIVPGIRLQLIF